MQKEPINKFSVTPYGSLEKINDVISKCRVRIFYKGLNRNRTYISEIFAEQLISTLSYVPIKGIYDKEDESFEGHGDNNSDGKIYGIVPENHNFAWESHIDDDGVERLYACCDVYLFTGIYPEALKIQGLSQSMEIFLDTYEGEWKIWEDGLPYFEFTAGCLVGLQILGEDVEPCFEGAAFYDLEPIISYIKKVENNLKQEGDKDMEFSLKLSFGEIEEKLFRALNPEYTEENWKVDKWLVKVWEDRVTVENKENGKFERYSYSIDENGEIQLGEPVEVFLEDVTEAEKMALDLLKETNGSFEKANETIETLKAEAAQYQTTIEELNSSKADSEEKIVELENSLNEAKESLAVQTTEFENEKVRFEKEKADLITERDSLAEFKAKEETTKKETILTKYSMYLSDELINQLKDTMATYSVGDFKKEVYSAVIENNPSFLAPESKEETLYFTQVKDTEGMGDKLTGMERLLNNYKNGGNK